MRRRMTSVLCVSLVLSCVPSHLDFRHERSAGETPRIHVGQVSRCGRFTQSLFYSHFKHSADSHSAGEGALSVPRIIINQFKWLDRVVDPKVVIIIRYKYCLQS